MPLFVSGATLHAAPCSSLVLLLPPPLPSFLPPRASLFTALVYSGRFDFYRCPVRSRLWRGRLAEDLCNRGVGIHRLPRNTQNRKYSSHSSSDAIATDRYAAEPVTGTSRFFGPIKPFSGSLNDAQRLIAHIAVVTAWRTTTPSTRYRALVPCTRTSVA